MNRPTTTNNNDNDNIPDQDEEERRQSRRPSSLRRGEETSRRQGGAGGDARRRTQAQQRTQASQIQQQALQQREEESRRRNSHHQQQQQQQQQQQPQEGVLEQQLISNTSLTHGGQTGFGQQNNQNIFLAAKAAIHALGLGNAAQLRQQESATADQQHQQVDMSFPASSLAMAGSNPYSSSAATASASTTAAPAPTGPTASTGPSLSMEQAVQQQTPQNFICQDATPSMSEVGGGIQQSNGSVVVPCKARRMPLDHTFKTAYFVIRRNIKHGEELICSYPACRNGGVKFRYCTWCRLSVTKKNFFKRHDHKNELLPTAALNNATEDNSAKDPPPAPAPVPILPPSRNVARATSVPTEQKPRPWENGNTGENIKPEPNEGKQIITESKASGSSSSPDITKVAWSSLLSERPPTNDAHAMENWIQRVVEVSKPRAPPASKKKAPGSSAELNHNAGMNFDDSGATSVPTDSAADTTTTNPSSNDSSGDSRTQSNNRMRHLITRALNSSSSSSDRARENTTEDSEFSSDTPTTGAEGSSSYPSSDTPSGQEYRSSSNDSSSDTRSGQEYRSSSNDSSSDTRMGEMEGSSNDSSSDDASQKDNPSELASSTDDTASNDSDGTSRRQEHKKKKLNPPSE